MTILLSKNTVKNILRFFSASKTSAVLMPQLDLEDFVFLLKECKSLRQFRSIHQQTLVNGLLSLRKPLIPSLQEYLRNNIIAAYLSSGALHEAQNALEVLSCHSVFWWNNLIRQHIQQGYLNHTLVLCCRMRRLGTNPDHFTFPLLLKACGDLSCFCWGSSIHAVICKDGFESNVFVCNALIAMYAHCDSLEEALHVFDNTCHRGIDDVVSWNSVVAAYVQKGRMHLAFEIFRKMATTNTPVGERKVDVISLVNVLPACASMRASSQGKQIHCFALRGGLFFDVFVGNAIVDMYAKCGMMSDALRVFNAMEVKDVVSWNAMVSGYSQSGDFTNVFALFNKMQVENIALNVVTWTAVISGYAQTGCAHEAIDVFRQMQLSRSGPNAVTVISLLSACASIGALKQGMETHSYAIKRCFVNINDNYNDGEELMVPNSLIDMYAKCKNLTAAQTLFDCIPMYNRGVVSWTVMIGGYSQHGDANNALELFRKMLMESEVYPNDFTLSCALMACSRLSALHFGKQIHAYVIRHNYNASMVFVFNSLIDTYSRCGDIGAVQKVFGTMPTKNSVSWTSLMTGYGMHGHGKDALLMFEKMQEAGLELDSIAFLVVLYACSHSGMVKQGLEYFHSMERDHGILPGVEHYACMVDLLGRAGRLHEARELILEMSVKPPVFVWVALLGACRIHNNLELAEYAAQKILELDSESDGPYTLLSNIYANAGRWKDVAKIRGLMKNCGIKKRPGCSWIQGQKGTSTFTFYVGDRSHPQSKEIYALLMDLLQRIKAIGYVPQTAFALHDVDEEEKSSLLSEHSEKLALAFGILTYSPGMPIRITKNLRVCGDCHSAFTFISKIVDHEIILRDSSRFHHFSKGFCSCGGYW